MYTHTFQSFSRPLLTVGHIQKGTSVQKRKHSIYTIQYIQALKKGIYTDITEKLCASNVAYYTHTSQPTLLKAQVRPVIEEIEVEA